MSEPQVPDNATTVPPVDELERVAIAGAFRRAPRLGRILGTGIAFGAGLGLVLGFALPNSTGVGRGMVAILLAVGFGMIGGLAAGAIATRADAASDRTPARHERAETTGEDHPHDSSEEPA